MKFITPQEMLKMRLRHRVEKLDREQLMLIKDSLEYFKSEHGYLDLFTDKDNIRMFFSDESDIELLKIRCPDQFL